MAEGKYDFDVVGHYARPDIFSLSVNDRPTPVVVMVTGPPRADPRMSRCSRRTLAGRGGCAEPAHQHRDVLGGGGVGANRAGRLRAREQLPHQLEQVDSGGGGLHRVGAVTHHLGERSVRRLKLGAAVQEPLEGRPRWIEATARRERLGAPRA